MKLCDFQKKMKRTSYHQVNQNKLDSERQITQGSSHFWNLKFKKRHDRHYLERSGRPMREGGQEKAMENKKICYNSIIAEILF